MGYWAYCTNSKRWQWKIIGELPCCHCWAHCLKFLWTSSLWFWKKSSKCMIPLISHISSLSNQDFSKHINPYITSGKLQQHFLKCRLQPSNCANSLQFLHIVPPLPPSCLSQTHLLSTVLTQLGAFQTSWVLRFQHFLYALEFAGQYIPLQLRKEKDIRRVSFSGQQQVLSQSALGIHLLFDLEQILFIVCLTSFPLVTNLQQHFL